MLNNRLLVIGILAAGSGLLTSCQKSVNIQVVPGFNKPVPVVQKGYVINWKTAAGADMPVQFEPFSPCDEGEKSTPTCHVNVDSGIFPYVCGQCEDPVVPVGSSINDQLKTAAALAVAHSANPGYVGVYCDPKTNTAAAVPETATTGSQFQWIPAGTKPPATWWVTLDQGTCKEGTEFGTRNGLLKCTVTRTTTGPYNYKVHVDGCATPDGAALLTVNAP